MRHGHFDHATDAKPLADRYGIKIYIHEADKATLDDPQLTVHHDHSPRFHALLDRLVGGKEKLLNKELRSYRAY